MLLPCHADRAPRRRAGAAALATLRPGEPHHEASGRWPTDDASPFPALAEQYPARVLIPASDCAFHSLTLPAGLRKPPLQVAPFLLEEQLADDVEATHFALLHRQQAQCEIVAVQRQKCATGWRAANRSPYGPALTPDVLALPRQPPAWSAVQVDEQWLIRHQPWGGMAAENVWLTELLQSEAEEHVIDSYSPPPAAPGVWREQPAQTLLTLAARHPAAQKLSLLQGSSPSGGGLRRRAGVRRGMPRWLWRYWQGQTACWTIAIWRVRPRRRNRPAGPSITAGFRRRKGD